MKTIHEQIAVMKHFAAGGKIEVQCRDEGCWMKTTNPVFNWWTYDYRVVEKVDPYAELKKIAADPTKQIRYTFPDGSTDGWHDCGYDWEWSAPLIGYEIRDKPKPMKKVNLLAWFTGERLTWMSEEYSPLEQWRRVPAEDKEIEVEQ